MHAILNHNSTKFSSPNSFDPEVISVHTDKFRQKFIYWSYGMKVFKLKENKWLFLLRTNLYCPSTLFEKGIAPEKGERGVGGGIKIKLLQNWKFYFIFMAFGN